MLGNIGTSEILLILAVGLVFFGAKQIPEIARSCGRALNSFKAGMKDKPEELESSNPADEKSSEEKPSKKA